MCALRNFVCPKVTTKAYYREMIAFYQGQLVPTAECKIQYYSTTLLKALRHPTQLVVKYKELTTFLSSGGRMIELTSSHVHKVGMNV